MSAINPVGNPEIKEFIEAFGIKYKDLASFILTIKPNDIVKIETVHNVQEEELPNIIIKTKSIFGVTLIKEEKGIQ